MTMSSNETTTGKLTDADLRQIYGRYVHLNGMNDYPGQMHAGFTYAMIPALKKIYADNKEKRVEAYTRHMSEYFNVTPYVGGLPLGVVLAMEEQNAQDPDFDTSTITGIKTALTGPLLRHRRHGVPCHAARHCHRRGHLHGVRGQHRRPHPVHARSSTSPSLSPAG